VCWDTVSNEQTSSKSIDWDWQESQFYGILRTYLSSGSVNLRSQRDNYQRDYKPQEFNILGVIFYPILVIWCLFGVFSSDFPDKTSSIMLAVLTFELSSTAVYVPAVI